MHPEVVDRPALVLASVRHVGPYHEIGSAFARLEAILAESGISPEPQVLAAVFHDNPQVTPAAALRSDAGVVITAESEVRAGLTRVILPAGRYLSLRHHGPYAGLPAAWAALRGALQEGGLRRADGAGYELYPNNPATAEPEALITELYIPLG